MVRWPLQPLQPFQKTQLQPPVGLSVDSLCHPWFTTTNLSYRFPIFETFATALCGTTGINYQFSIAVKIWWEYLFIFGDGSLNAGPAGSTRSLCWWRGDQSVVVFSTQGFLRKVLKAGLAWGFSIMGLSFDCADSRTRKRFEVKHRFSRSDFRF